MQVVLRNRDYPEYGVATIPFPIPREEYDHCIKLLEALEIGDAVRQDCQVLEVSVPLCVEKRENRWSLAQNWISALWMGGRG